MKINIADVVQRLRNKTPVSINKESLTDDMKVIYSYYVNDSEKPQFLISYYKRHNNFSLIPFTSTYIGQLVGTPINISTTDNVVTLYTN